MVYSKIEVSTKEEFLNAFLKDEYFPGNIKLNKNLSELTVFQYIEKLFIENCDNIKLKYLYARCLNLGFGCEIDFKLSNKLFVECGEFPMAEYALAISYRKGEGVTKNINRAIELYKKAASAGFGYAQKNLGLLFYYGEEIETDLNKAK